MSGNAVASEREISIVLDTYPHTRAIKEGQIASPGIKLNFIEYNPINKAFNPMVEEQKFDVCEMAVGTFFQALDSGKPLKLLPAVMGGEFHHGSLWYEPKNGALTPGDLKGKRVGVRAYTQTTGIWVRGVLQEQYGVPCDDVTWVTSEAPHVEGYVNPPNVELSKGADLTQMLRDGELSAVIIGPKQGNGAGFTHLIPNVDAASAAWYEKHKTVPINHMVVVTEKLIKNDAAAVLAITDLFRQGIESVRAASAASPQAIRFGKENVWDALELAIRYSFEQKLISRVFKKEEVFA